MSSASWPWMEGIEVPIADPIDPVCPEDDRPSVKSLIEEHEVKIAKIRAALEEDPLFQPSKHDDLWILRFWLSHKKSKNAIEAAKYTLAFRREHKLDEKDIRSVPPHHVKEGVMKEMLSCWKDNAMIFTHPHPQRGVVGFFKLSSMDQHNIVKHCPAEYWLEGLMYPAEWSFQWLDYVTRTTGRFTKAVRLIDCDGVTFGSFNRECSKRDGKAMGLMEDCYPQSLESIFACNPPSIIGRVWKVFSPLLPQRVVSKFDIMNPKESRKDHQKLLKHISNTDLPDFYGGKNPVSPERW